MDKRKYLTKTLITEYQYISDLEDCNYTEIAYRLKDNQIVMEFNGEGFYYLYHKDSIFRVYKMDLPSHY